MDGLKEGDVVATIFVVGLFVGDFEGAAVVGLHVGVSVGEPLCKIEGISVRCLDGSCDGMDEGLHMDVFDGDPLGANEGVAVALGEFDGF